MSPLPADVDGVKPGRVATPADADELAALLVALGENGEAAVVCGGGSRLGVGNPPRRADVLLSTAGLAGIRELDADEGVVRVGAGTRLRDLAAAAVEGGWEVPLGSHSDEATIGGVLASCAVGPRFLHQGPVRDHVLGLAVVLASGERARCGGRVVKNVTGYDLMKLHTGGFGTLGVIEEAWLRLRPRPSAVRHHVAWLPAGDSGFERGHEAAELPSCRSVVWVDPAQAGRVLDRGPGGGRVLLLTELAGAPELVARDAARLEGWAFEASDGTGLERAARLAPPEASPTSLRFRLTLRPRRMAAAGLQLSRSGASILAWPGTGVLYASFPLYDGADELTVASAFRAAMDTARSGRGCALLESAPAWAKGSRDVFGEAPDALPIMRTLKERFDPLGVLNPGRFVGGI